MNRKTHEQTRWELVGGAIVAAVIAAVGIALITWALTVPVKVPADRMPQVSVTEYVEA